MKRCKKKAQLGTILLGVGSLISSLIGAGTAIGGAVSNKRAQDEATAQQILNNNLKNSSLQANNMAAAYNSAETEINDNLRTLHSAMKCGGKKTRTKKACGGRGRYI